MEPHPRSRALPSDAAVSFVPMAPDELAGFTEVMATLAVSKRTARKYVDRADFPAPVDRLATGRVWRRADVERWGRENLPLRTGRPPKPPEHGGA